MGPGTLKLHQVGSQIQQSPVLVTVWLHSSLFSVQKYIRRIFIDLNRHILLTIIKQESSNFEDRMYEVNFYAHIRMF